MRSLLSFRHGVHPPDHKQATEHIPVRRMSFPDEVILHLRQHTGKPARLCVKPGDRVERGDVVAQADGFVSSPVHATTTGTIVALELWPHPDGSRSQALRIAVERHSAQVPRPRLVPEWRTLSAKELIAAIRDAGLVGLGGAAFPTHVKLSPPEDKKIDTLLINGCECEPYLTADHRAMVEHPEKVQHGIRILLHALGIERAMIGIESNKPDAVEALRATLPDDLDVTVHPLRVKYPQGAEKMLIRALIGCEVPSGGLPMDVGVLVQNIASVEMIATVFESGLPLIERTVSVTGGGVRRPANLTVPIGTKLRDVLDACGGLTEDVEEIVFGGPMMGMAQADLNVPTVKGTGGIVVLSKGESRQGETHPCIRCGHCLDACPIFLNPQNLGALALARRWDEMEAQNLMDCMLCGCCSYACPSSIPLSQLFALAKTSLRKSSIKGKAA